jgi:hypothetical protein
MREERHPGDLRESGTRAARPLLIAAGVVAGIAVLVCGGVAGHVAWTDAHRAVEESKSQEKAPERADAILKKIAKIDIPAGWVPVDGVDRGQVRRAIFGRKSAEGFLLQLSKIDFTMAPPGIDRNASSSMPMQMLELENSIPGQSPFTPDPEGPVATHTVTVLGEPTPFKFAKGRIPENQEPAWKVSGTFTTETGLVALLYIVPEDDYDEEAVIRMIESIGPTEDDLALQGGPD